MRLVLPALEAPLRRMIWPGGMRPLILRLAHYAKSDEVIALGGVVAGAGGGAAGVGGVVPGAAADWAAFGIAAVGPGGFAGGGAGIVGVPGVGAPLPEVA